VVSDGRAIGGVSAEEVMKLRQVYMLEGSRWVDLAVVGVRVLAPL
jgi:hypothetical protein